MTGKKSNNYLCKSCGRKVSKISQNGNCIKCSTAKVAEANVQIRLRRGPIYEKYKKNLSARLEEI